MTKTKNRMTHTLLKNSSISALGLCAVSFGLSDIQTYAAAVDQPNVLMICVDDMNDWVGFLGGHPQAKTPNMNSLAAKGVNFTNAHCTAPGCSPSRNALLLGVEPHNSGLYPFYNLNHVDTESLERFTPLPLLFKRMVTRRLDFPRSGIILTTAIDKMSSGMSIGCMVQVRRTRR